ncbi:hypothetical protein [Streptomyces ziwulingensis]|uniref:Integral membrane protein n=1 Tax=Streptomyces ziwulingensis TaxID=1045501 RepID=A0ABP9CV23_9ACTN
MRPRAWVLLLAAVFALLQLTDVTGRSTPDSKNYVSYALSLAGAQKREAAAGAIEHFCASRASDAKRAQSVHVVRFHRADPAPLVRAECREREWRAIERGLRAGRTGGHTAPFMPERFMRIFEARPGYPVFLVPFVTLLGVTWGVWTAGVLLAAGGGVLAFLILRTVSVPVPFALTGQALYYVLPTGATAMRPMTEGLLLALTLAAVWGCALVLCAGRARAGFALVAGASAALFTVKHSQALFLGGCLAAAGAAVAWRRHRRGRPPGPDVLRLAAVGLGSALATVALARLLHHPSESESLQDLLTHHFARPDRARPWAEFFQLQGNFWTEWSRRQARDPLFVTALAAGVWGALRRPAFGAFVVAAAATGVLTQAGHPDVGIGGRLIVMAWLLPVLGVPLLLAPVVRDGMSLPAQGHTDRVRAVN